MSTKPELSGPARDAEISRLAREFPEPGSDKVRLKVSDPDSGRAATFRLRPADAKHLGALMRTCGMKTETGPDLERDRPRGRRRSR